MTWEDWLVPRSPIDLAVVACLAAATMVLTLVGVNVPGLNAALAGPLVFVLPGYALSTALFPAGTRRHAEQLLLSLGLSLAVVALGGLALNLTPGGIRARSWAVLLCLITVEACLVAVIRRRRVLPDSVESLRWRLTPAQSGMFAAAALLVGGSLWVARTPAPQQANQTYSLLWAVPASDAQPNVIRVGVDSGESETTAYIVRVVAGSQQLEEFRIQLAPAEVWQTELKLAGRTDGTLEVQLYKASAPDVVYRQVALRGRG
jgi:hypothetical protein